MIAIIPARGGSKGVIGKNTKLLNGKPLIGYTIEAAKKAKTIDRVFVSTDSEEIANVAISFGAEVPFIRPKELAGDDASAVDVYLHAAEFLLENKIDCQKFMVLLPTAPLRTCEHIDAAVNFFYEEEAETLISVTEAEIPVSWYLKRDSKKRLASANFGDKSIIANRQENSKYYVPNGAIYILDYNLLKDKRTYYSANSVGFEMSAENSIDIDTYFDFKIAELLLKERI